MKRFDNDSQSKLLAWLMASLLAVLVAGCGSGATGTGSGPGGGGNNSSGAGDATSGGGGGGSSVGTGAGSSGTATSEGSNTTVAQDQFKVGDQIMVKLDGGTGTCSILAPAYSCINVRGAPVLAGAIVADAPPPIFQQISGVHGTVVNTCPSAGKNCTAWYQINWDSEPASQFGLDQNTNKYGPNQYGPPGWSQGWSAGSDISLVPSGDITQEPDLTNSNYQSSDNPYSYSQSSNSQSGPNGPSSLDTSTNWSLGKPDSPSPDGKDAGGHYGNCTWYTYGRMLELGQGSQQRKDQLAAITKFILPDGNNASQWITNAKNSSGVSVHDVINNKVTVNGSAKTEPVYIPQVGDIAAIDKGTGSSSEGHVTVVESVNNAARTTYTVSESSYSINDAWNVLWRRRTINLTDHSPVGFDYFIHLDKF